MVLTPRQKFQGSETYRADMERLCNQLWFHDAVEAATLQYIHELSSVTDIPDAALFQRIVGAHDFQKILLRLGDRPKEAATKNQGALNHGI